MSNNPTDDGAAEISIPDLVAAESQDLAPTDAEEALEQRPVVTSPEELKLVVEATLLASAEPLTLERILAVFGERGPDRDEIRAALAALGEDCANRSYELKRVASGYRLQIRTELAPWIGRLHAERPPRYSRALLETLVLVAYRQPVTRGDIEQVRGVSVSSNIIRTLLDRNWIKVVGTRDVPGRPAMYGTTREFLDYFNLQSLNELPPLAEIRDLDRIGQELELALDGKVAAAVGAPDLNAQIGSTADAETADTTEAAEGAATSDVDVDVAVDVHGAQEVERQDTDEALEGTSEDPGVADLVTADTDETPGTGESDGSPDSADSVDTSDAVSDGEPAHAAVDADASDVDADAVAASTAEEATSAPPARSELPANTPERDAQSAAGNDEESA